MLLEKNILSSILKIVKMYLNSHFVLTLFNLLLPYNYVWCHFPWIC